MPQLLSRRRTHLLLVCLCALTLVMATVLAFAGQYVRSSCDDRHLPCTHAARAPEDIAYLRVNQVGYLPSENKLAFVLTNENASGQSFNVIAANDASIVFTGSVGGDRGAYGNFSHLYELNLVTLTLTGTYRVRLGADTSPTFTLGASAYGGVLAPTLTFFRIQHCGNPALLHGVCHLTDGTVANGVLSGTHVNVSGGWHDAGDYLKFVVTTGFAATLMLHAYQRHPEVFADSDDNGVPDVLDEARVGLDWLLKMWVNDPDPAKQVLFYQVGDYQDHQYGWRMPERDDIDHPNRPVFACEDGKGANIAGKTAAAFALGAVLWNDPSRPFYNPARAATYRTAAQQIYAYGKLRPAAQPSTSDISFSPPFTFYNEINWEDEMALAAAELYRATGNANYLSEARTYATLAGSRYEFGWGEVAALADYEIARLDPTFMPTATTYLLNDLSAYQSGFNANRFGAVTTSQWGSAAVMAGAALSALWYEDLTGDSTYHRMAQAQRDYLLGDNPWGVSFVNGVGATWPRHPHHQVADLTGAELTGFWDEGPVSQAVFLAQGITLTRADVYAAFQSPEAVYHDDVADYITNEPTLTLNALGVALSSWYAPVAATPPKLYLPAVSRQ